MTSDFQTTPSDTNNECRRDRGLGACPPLFWKRAFVTLENNASLKIFFVMHLPPPPPPPPRYNFQFPSYGSDNKQAKRGHAAFSKRYIPPQPWREFSSFVRFRPPSKNVSSSPCPWVSMGPFILINFYTFHQFQDNLSYPLPRMQ